MERYKDKQLSAYERAAALADTLSTEEQAQQLKYDAPAIEKAGLPSYNWWNEGLHGVARAGYDVSCRRGGFHRSEGNV